MFHATKLTFIKLNNFAKKFHIETKKNAIKYKLEYEN